MAGKNVADICCGIETCTTHWKEYSLDFGGETFKVFETVGLDEPQLGILPMTLSRNWREKVVLIFFCSVCRQADSKLRTNAITSYFAISSVIRFPIVLAITNLEREKENMESW
jgi:hypothetical protein